MNKGLDTLNTVSVKFRKKLEKGTVCPCCKRYAKIYERKLTPAMVEGLILFYTNYQRTNIDWIHAEDFFKKQQCRSQIRGDFSKLRYWGLIDLLPYEGGVLIGCYQLTVRGINFVRGHQKVPSSAHIYNDTILGFADDKIGIHDAIKGKFDYEALMSQATTQRKLF